MAFTTTNWKHLTDRMAWVEGRLKAKGATVESPTFLPPIDRAQVEAFQKETGLRLPDDLVTLVTQHAGGWRFYWNLHVDRENRWLEPDPPIANFGGNGEVPFIGASKQETLLDLYRGFQESIHETYVVDSGDAETLRLLPKVFPLHLFEGGGGDYLVLRLDREPCDVVFLDHEIAYPIDEKHVLGRGLGEFLRRWANVGYPECGKLLDHIDPATRQIADDAADMKGWVRWLDNREAR